MRFMMKCTVCDICKNPINYDDMCCIRKNQRKFSVFKKYYAYDGFEIIPMKDKVDLCGLCYQELIEIVKERISGYDI